MNTTRRPPLYLALFAALLVACAPTPSNDYDRLANRFDAKAPGRGLDSYAPSVSSDHAMAYGLIASADARWHARTGDARALERAKRAATWLVENRDVDGDGLVGWGLSFTWDAFADGTTNPIGWPYTITTALGVQGLLDVHEVTRDPQLLAVALEATRAMLDHSLVRAGDEAWFQYSPAEHDAHPVFNVSSMMLGQLQRLAVVEPALAEAADLVAAHLLRAQLVDGEGRVFWMYSAPGAPSDDRENDLVHVAYIVQGLADYARFGGAIEVDVLALYESLGAFLMPDGGVSEMPFGEAPARDWGVGAALYAVALMEQELGVDGGLSAHFYRAAAAYGPPKERFYPRQAAHVLLGLAMTTEAPEQRR